jgi:hypothetical protein
LYRHHLIGPYLGFTRVKTERFLEQHKDYQLICEEPICLGTADFFGKEAMDVIKAKNPDIIFCYKEEDFNDSILRQFVKEYFS